MKYQLHTLKNGLRIALLPIRDAKTATVMIMSGTGSRYEDEKENGLAHFLEHMFFKGTVKRPSARAISEELDAIGSSYNAFTAKERTAYYAKVNSRYLSVALDVISDIFLHSTLPTKEITKERGAVIQEIDMYEDMPMRTVDNVFDELLFGATHPLGRTILGPKENIHRFSRKDFSAYLKRNYTPINTVVSVAGAFSEEKVLAKIRKEFGGLPHGNPPDYVRFSPAQDIARVAIKFKKTDQSHIMLGAPAYPFLHTDEYVLDVLATILGGGMSSRLFSEVREKRGLAYYVRAWNEKYPDSGYFAVQAGIAHDKLEQTVRTILTELKKMKQKAVSAEELKKAKSYIQGTLALGLETSDSLAEHAASSLINIGRVRTTDEISKGVERVTAEDVQRVASDIFRTNTLNLAIIGPHTNPEHLMSILKV